jgi:hypothetical protein
MLRRRKEETPRSLIAGSLLTRLLRRGPGVSGCLGFGSRPHSHQQTDKASPNTWFEREQLQRLQCSLEMISTRDGINECSG